MTAATTSPADQITPTTAAAARVFSPTVLGLVAAGLIAAAHLPLVVTYFQRLLLFDHYEFVPLVLIGVPILLFIRARQIPRNAWRRGFPHRALLTSCGILAVASLFGSPWAAVISLILSLGLWLRYYSAAYWRTLLPVWLLLFLVIRPPMHLDLSLITWLQIETSRISSMVLDNIGVKHLMDGNVLVIPERRFLVEEACSGINSVFALLTAAATYAVCVHATPVRAVLLIVSAVFWACFMNLVRIAATIFAFEQFQFDLGEGIAHSITGFVTFALAVLFVAFTDQLARFFLDPIDPIAVDYWKQRLNPFIQWWNRTGSVPPSEPRLVESPTDRAVWTVPAFLGIGIVSVLLAGWQLLGQHVESLPHATPSVIVDLDAESLPETLGDWARNGYEVEYREKNSFLGDVSKIWTYRGPASAALISVDYPFRGWHT
ncbi:MAG: exosortase U, partial [Planctomycetaceae bacterium]|nr:exosortase U [Planctomycetaceae bacterium]